MDYSKDSESDKPESSKKKSKKERKFDPNGKHGFPWWACPLDQSDSIEKGLPQPHEVLDRVYEEIRQDQEGRYEAYKEYERIFGADNCQAGTDEAINMLVTGELKQNELANTIETLHAQVFKDKVVPAVATSEADFEEWFRAKAYGRWMEGVMEEGDVFSDAESKAGLYALVYGTGPIKVIPCKYTVGKKKYGKVKARAINPKYLLVDRIEAKHGRPRTLFQKDHIDRYQVLDEFGADADGCYGDGEEREATIYGINSNDDDDLPTSSVMKCDMLTVKEAWRLPSSPGAGDGRHCIWVKGCTLVYEEFDWDSFPFTFIRFGNPLEGFWGVSAVKKLAGCQEQLDELNAKVKAALEVMAVPRIIVRKNSGIKKADIDDIPGGVLEADDPNGIRDWNAIALNPEVYQERDSLPSRMRSLMGVSDFQVEQALPTQTREFSAPAMERLVGEGQARHAVFHNERESNVVRLGYLFVDAAAWLEDDGYEVVVKAPGQAKSSIETLKFSEVKVDKDRMKLVVMPISHLPHTFAGKIEAIQKLRELLPSLDPRTVARMTEVPDVSGTTDMMVSDEEVIMKQIAYILKTKSYWPPMPFDNHELIIQLCTRFINCYRVKEDADTVVIGLLLQYMEEAIRMKKGIGAPNANAPPMVPPGPIGPIGPTGEMVPPPGMVPGQGAPPPLGGPPPMAGAPPLPMQGMPAPPMQM